MSKNTGNLAQSAWRNPRKRNFFADLVTSIDRDENSYEVQENILLPVFWKKKATEKTVSLHRKEKVTKKSNTGKAKKSEKDQRSIGKVKRLKIWDIILNISLPLYFEIQILQMHFA